MILKKNENEHEKQKYIDLYIDKNNIYKKKYNYEYGHRNHAGRKKIYKTIKSLKINSICDVGCGGGEFCDWMTKKCKNVFGVDFASVKINKVVKNDKIKYIDAEAYDIPLSDKSVEFVSCFDCLEHCLEKDIDKILKEFKRIAINGYIFTITYRQARTKSLNKEQLHMTVKPEDWWIKKIKNVNPNIEIFKIGKRQSCLLCLF